MLLVYVQCVVAHLMLEKVSLLSALSTAKRDMAIIRVLLVIRVELCHVSLGKKVLM